MEMNNQPPAPSTPAGPHNHMDYGHGMWCNCGGHGYHRHFVLRWILGIILLAVVFCLGFKLGFLHANMYGYGGYGDHHRDYPMMRYYDMPAPMMTAPQNSAPAQPAAPAPAPTK